MAIECGKINFKNHYLCRTSDDIKTIVKPLNRFGITMFDHFRIYDDNSAIDLTTVPEFCELFAKEHLYREGCVGNHDDYKNGYFFWDTLLGQTVVHDALKQHCNVGHGIIVIKTYEDYCDHFYFGADLNNPGIKNFFINQKHIIENFIAYYYCVAERLISRARPHSYSFPNDKRECNELLNPVGFNEGDIAEFNQSLSRWVIHPLLKKTKLSKRELQCIYHSSLGEPARVVASSLNIATKTVERHLENARAKLSVKNKMALLKLVNDLNPNLLANL